MYRTPQHLDCAGRSCARTQLQREGRPVAQAKGPCHFVHRHVSTQTSDPVPYCHGPALPLWPSVIYLCARVPWRVRVVVGLCQTRQTSYASRAPCRGFNTVHVPFGPVTKRSGPRLFGWCLANSRSNGEVRVDPSHEGRGAHRRHCRHADRCEPRALGRTAGDQRGLDSARPVGVTPLRGPRLPSPPRKRTRPAPCMCDRRSDVTTPRDLKVQTVSAVRPGYSPSTVNNKYQIPSPEPRKTGLVGGVFRIPPCRPFGPAPHKRTRRAHQLMDAW